ncbi:fungal chitin synthase [Rhizoclosmatium globosum]|uniref:chitin synthase n=1 Tax=Rhizoclosmatium globosum TaxID=329046 RepID=A0A1Y2BTP2_9FUNG|nr:fungal chitin synthase [Rhizoclosmatium globosum]|eukprot:ORY38111.1 fungal chitin synthase [Rhizoclosmatium globosum]
MVELDSGGGYPRPAEYLAIAEGRRQRNMGVVYGGWYVTKCGRRVATVVVVKCGTVEENGAGKPGNRGKRDSQMVLMNFLSRCLFDDKMTRLDYEMRFRIQHLMNVEPSQFDYVLMVDADTDVDQHALKHMITAMLNDRNIMGLCGETKVRNKFQSWVTMIQVFEYYASHHLGKAFESVFGGVTCLPGCFSMYRIKAKKGNNEIVPLLINPDIVDEYSENIVETLHKRNLLLLGEDRFLSTLMLRNFPRRKMMFVPQAICHTVVPDEFKVLLSQRRRWINSTIHNLMELLLVGDLCGVFCFSMQFVVFLELVGTVVLPAAISFTIFLLIQTAVTGQVQLIPMLLLLFILGLPGLMIVVTTRQMEYIGWLGVYILSLPLWNFVLPTYAFWHFDDFSWGQTRMVHGEVKGGDKEGHHGVKSGEEVFDPSVVALRTWEEWNQRTVTLGKGVGEEMKQSICL